MNNQLGRGAKRHHGIKTGSTGSTGSPTGSTGSPTGSTGSPTGSTGSPTSGVGQEKGHQTKNPLKDEKIIIIRNETKKKQKKREKKEGQRRKTSTNVHLQNVNCDYFVIRLIRCVIPSIGSQTGSQTGSTGSKPDQSFAFKILKISKVCFQSLFRLFMVA